MKNLTYYEKKNAVLGVILMTAMITLYQFFSEGFYPAGIFRVMFPAVWLAYTVMLIVTMVLQRRSVVVFSSNDWVLRAANLLCVVGLVVGYTFYVYPVSISSIELQQSALTMYIIFLMFLYIWAVFREKSPRRMGFGVQESMMGMSDLFNSLEDEK